MWGVTMDKKRKVIRGVAVLAVALAAGHLVQNMGNSPAPKPVASAELTVKPVKVETVAAGPEMAPSGTAPVSQPAALPPAPATASTVAPLIIASPPVVAPTLAPNEADASTTTAAETAPEPALPELVLPAGLTASDATAPMQAATADPCATTLDLMTEANAMIGITLLAPCHPNQRVVLRQGGLAVTAQTTSTGAIFTALPAFETDAQVEAAFADGTKVSGSIAVPELATLRRFGVQWQADDAFQVHAFENGAGYDGPGHVSAANPHRPGAGLQAKGGFLSLLGDASTDNPLLAEVYTFPADPAAKPEVVVEAAVTDKTCGRELLAETLTSTGGSVFVTDLTLAMPDCDALGDYLVLKNLFLDLNMASLN